MSSIVYNPYSSSLQVLPSVEWARNLVKQITSPTVIYNLGYSYTLPEATIDTVAPGHYYCYNKPLCTLHIGAVQTSNIRSIITFEATGIFSCPSWNLNFQHLVPGRMYRIDILQGLPSFSSLYTNRITP